MRVPGDFTPSQYDQLAQRSADFQTYAHEKATCTKWPEDPHCHAAFSHPYGPHFQPPPEQDIKFPQAPKSYLQLFLYQVGSGRVIPCSDAAGDFDILDLSKIKIEPACRLGSDPSDVIRTKTGDVLYVTYDIHPNMQQWLLPREIIKYNSVDDDDLYNFIQNNDPRGTAANLPCKWGEENLPQKITKCLLRKQRRYEYNLSAGLIASTSNGQVQLPPGSERRFGGSFRIPAELTSDYNVYFEVLAAKPPVYGSVTQSIRSRLGTRISDEAALSREGFRQVPRRRERLHCSHRRRL